jgi:hypothetical protein
MIGRFGRRAARAGFRREVAARRVDFARPRPLRLLAAFRFDCFFAAIDPPPSCPVDLDPLSTG